VLNGPVLKVQCWTSAGKAGPKPPEWRVRDVAVRGGPRHARRSRPGTL